MYPGGELTRLAARKEYLRARIAVHREEAALAASELARPLVWADHAVERWRTISPLVRVIGVPLALILARGLMRRMGRGKWMTLAQAVPVVMRAARAYSRARS